MKKCFSGLCPDFKSRYQLSKKAENEADTIAKLVDQNKGFTRVSHRPTLEGIGIIRPVTEYEAFGSRSSAFNGIKGALEDDNVNIIGVYGMRGVGKTTLVKEIARETKENQLFDEVVLVVVTQTSNTVNIQNEFSSKLGLKLDEPSLDVRAARLHVRLKKLTKVLIILDDIWVEQDLGALGILPTDEHKGLKMLMTSRKLVVLKLMGSQKSLPIAKKVTQKCEGLSIAIAALAKALKYKENLYEWEDAPEQLKPSEINFRGISGAVYSAIEMSYKYLEREELKFTFLLCCIMGHIAAIEGLLKCCRGLGLFRGLDTIKKVLNRVLAVASELKDSSLLLADSTPECFDMDDVVCDVAISIASRDHNWLSLGKENVFEGWSNEESMRNHRLISVQKTMHLSRLTTLEVRVPDVQAMPQDDLFLGNTERYKISVEHYSYPCPKWMETSNGTEDVREMLDDPTTEGFPHLKHLKLYNVSDIKVVINSRMLVSCLESLSLYYLLNIGNIPH
ncbi:disease resistance protein At4g27190-like [Gossypium raimondii]|uniref:disease resistance protein At4g27190-like n=1 Tax=Gossypium raimondii TaxID=29730 RepID=UPI00063A9282|nr:disease resistance protein At4g27190-like [Gossypium raimondii]